MSIKIKQGGEWKVVSTGFPLAINEAMIQQRAEIDETFVSQTVYAAEFSDQKITMEQDFAKKTELDLIWDSMASAFARGVQEA